MTRWAMALSPTYFGKIRQRCKHRVGSRVTSDNIPSTASRYSLAHHTWADKTKTTKPPKNETLESLLAKVALVVVRHIRYKQRT